MEAGQRRGKAAAHYHYMADAMRRLEWDLHHRIEASGRIPMEWHRIAQEEPRPGTERVSMRFDRDVMRFFRSLGPGYGPRINRVLRAYMHARLAGVLQGAETAPAFRVTPEGDRPIWGDSARRMGVGEPPGPQEEAEAAREAVEAEVRRRQLGR